GGVGTFAVQIAKSFGAEVTGVCSTRNLDMVRSIGADHVIDYTQQDFTKNGQTYDLIYCAVGNRPATDYKRALNPNGICVVVGFTTISHMLFRVVLPGAWVSMTAGKKIGAQETVTPNKEDLVFIKELLEAGKVRPVIDRTHSLSEVPAAIRYLEEGHARGKVVITV
ncbi:MAG: NAD(P)-dependent alcohol dehydrogenase, partial [Armatimonadetes bacterium]|nr:NAD(P)-dependent alcohol dehydrogenase [Armatimonadota bacterium]